MTQDHLGNTRIISNENGVITNRKDFAAFGETTATAQRVSGTSGNGYDAPMIREDYTGYEKDMETGLEFAQARFFNPTQGRYTSVDPMIASATIKNPQTFNRYSYVLNSPYKFTDPLGLLSAKPKDCTKSCIVNGDRFFGDDLLVHQQSVAPEPPPPPATPSESQQGAGASVTLTALVARNYRVGDLYSDFNFGTLTVTVTQENSPGLRVRNINGTEGLVIGVDLTFTFSDENGPLVAASVRESVESSAGGAVTQTTGTTMIDSKGRGSDLVSNVYPGAVPGPQDIASQRAAGDYFSKNFETKQKLTLSITTSSGINAQFTQERMLTNKVPGAPRIQGIRGYTFTMEPNPSIKVF